MSYGNEFQIFLKRFTKLAFICSPLLFFMFYLFSQDHVTISEFVFFLFLLFISLLIMNSYFQKKINLLKRKTVLQTHDNQTTKENQFLLMNIMEKLSDPLLLLDSRNRIALANKSAHNLLGDHILRQDITLFIRNSGLEETINKALKTKTSESYEFDMGSPVAKSYLARIHSFSRLHDVTNSSLKSQQYTFLTLYDISAMKHSEKMRVDFVANASHELRTPLTSILGFIETLQGPARTDKEASSRFLKIMHDEAMRMSRLIEDLLSLSRIERDVHISPSDQINLPQLIGSVIEVLSPQAHEKNMSFELTTSVSSSLTGDYDQLTQVFQNLIENAIKYGEQDTKIEVICFEDTITELNAPGAITITITNAGPGIPAEHLPRLMERFYRVDSARSRSLGGTGLGLAIVKHIVQRHGGRIFFESEVNKYTKVTLTLPI